MAGNIHEAGETTRIRIKERAQENTRYIVHILNVDVYQDDKQITSVRGEPVREPRPRCCMWNCRPGVSANTTSPISTQPSKFKGRRRPNASFFRRSISVAHKKTEMLVRGDYVYAHSESAMCPEHNPQGFLRAVGRAATISFSSKILSGKSTYSNLLCVFASLVIV